MELPKGKMWTVCNLAILTITILVLLHILGYVDIQLKTREGMSSSTKTIQVVLMWIGIVLGIIYIAGTSFNSDKI
jgi:DMSO/TMAO reductase YedYZ heme-binding membrane subunit